MRSRHLYCVSLMYMAAALFAGVARAQNPWTVTIGSGVTALRVSTCTAITVIVTDPATGTRARNSLGALVTIADFDMTVTATGGAVVGRYSGASAWAACGCPASAGAKATVTATYPAKSLPAASRMRNVSFTATQGFMVVAGTSTSTPIGCETTRTITQPIGSTAPWTATLIANANPLAIGQCTPVSIDLRDATGKEEPRNPAGVRVTIADFNMGVTSGGKSVIGLNNYGVWSVCACQGATVGDRATITADYPAKSVAQAARVPGVVFQSLTEIPIATAKSAGNPPACASAANAAAPSAAAQPAAATPAAPQPIAVAPSAPKTAAPAPAAITPIPVTATPVTKTPVGPTPTANPPRNVQVSGNQTQAIVTWAPPLGTPAPVSYVVERWKTADPSCCRATSRTFTYETQWTELMMWTGPWTYQVTATYADGLRGSSSTQYNYPEPETPKGLKAEQIARNTVMFTWQPVAGASYYVVSGPPTNVAQKVFQPTLTQTGVPFGNTTWKVGTIYEASSGNPPPQAGSPLATTNLVVLNPHYRLVAEAIRVTTETADKQFSEDGMYDEVFVASYTETLTRRTSISNGGITRQPFLLSAVHGDTNVPMELRRVKAGTASGSGGIRAGDVVTPVLTEQTITSPPAPFVLWDGELVPGQHDLVLHPTIWEVDQTESERSRDLSAINTPNCRSLLCGWAQFMTGVGGGGSAGHSYISGAVLGSHIAVVEGGKVWFGTNSGGANHLERQDVDRPIGLQVPPEAATEGVGLTGDWYDRAVVLSSEKIEAALASGNNKIEVRYWDRTRIPNTAPTSVNYLHGDYTLVIRIERVP